MNQRLEFSLSPERLDKGDPEELATFGQFRVTCGELNLTEGFDANLGGYREGPYVAGYYAAEWFAWNWWRLRYEPQRNDRDWFFAHQMNAIGNGYQWPNITIHSDGLRTVLASRRSTPHAEPFRYAGAPALIVPARDFETAIDLYITQMIERVSDLGETNLHRIWHDLVSERFDPELAKRRRLEALLGSDPDAGNEYEIETFVEDAHKLGQAAVDEVAAERGADSRSSPLHVDDFHSLARQLGYEGRSSDTIAPIRQRECAFSEELEPWEIGANLAHVLRQREKLGEAALSDARLAEMAGVSKQSLSSHGKAGAPFSFALESGPIRWRTVFRSARKTGRRFDLARMIGDYLLSSADDRLHPATDATTWRQQAQRSFAVELLAPIELVSDRLAGDYSVEKQHDVADQFVVSPMAINSLLKNHHLIPRDEPFRDISGLAA